MSDVANTAVNLGSHVMLNASRIMLFVFGLLLSTAGSAEDAKNTISDPEPLPAVTFNVERLLAESWYVSQWQLAYPVDSIAGLDDWPQSTARFNFRKNSVLGRISELRNLSFLTLARVGQTRLFLGVNEDGLVGLHFNAIARDGDERYLELVRMPYITDTASDSGAK